MFIDLLHFSLEYLDMGNSDLFNISENAFRGKLQHTIKVLNMSHNLLDQVPSAQLSQLASLEEIYIGGNPDIQQISENCLPQLRRLKVIDLSYSYNLAKIESYAFRDNVNLKRIILDGNIALSSSGYSDGQGINENALTVVSSPSMFSFLDTKSPKISIALELRSMQLYSINPNIVGDWDTVNSIDMSNNPLHCDCKLLWLHDVLIETRKRKENLNEVSNDKNSSSPLPSSLVPCSSPVALFNVPLALVPRNQIESCESHQTMSLPGIKTPQDQLILILVCVSSAVFTGIIIFIAVHCRGRHCRFGNENGSSIQRKCLPTSASSTTTSTSASSFSGDSLMRGARCRCCQISFKSCKQFFSRCFVPSTFVCCRPSSPRSSSSSPSSTYEITSCCTLR